VQPYNWHQYERQTTKKGSFRRRTIFEKGNGQILENIILNNAATSGYKYQTAKSKLNKFIFKEFAD